ncbi:MAG: pirin family protein [Gammaproteobacteria bacterium]|nr:pirin family protein [Gammaproteobacteria bacterium]
MLEIRPAEARGHVSLDWLDSHHTFSFGEYHDPRFMGTSILRVINDDVIAPGGGFATHGHRDMEIVTYVLDGELAHRDSMGNGSVIRPGEVQHMSAGSGVRHSEMNPSADTPVHLLQIWLLPNAQGVTPAYHQQLFPPQERRGRLALLVSPDGRAGSIATHQDGFLYGTLLRPGETVTHPLAPGRRAYVHVARGSVRVEGETLKGGDGAFAADLPGLRLEGVDDAEALLFDLP